MVERLRTRFKLSITAALTATLCACTPGLVKPARVMEMATPAALLLVLNVRDRTPPDISGVANVADAAVAAGLTPNAGDPIIVTTSLLKAGITADGVMAMVTVNPAVLASTSDRLNVGPVRPPLTI